jgi:class 3 adenylate cyclase
MDEGVERILRCLPAQLVARWGDPARRGALEMRERDVAIAFVDVEGCTRLCEDLPPREMSEIMEAYFSRFFDAIESAGGLVLEILGDGFMAIFENGEVRSSTRAAASAALAIQRETEALNGSRRGMHDPLVVNIGIHVGTAFVGLARFRTSVAERWTYTASGSVPNIAARLCALATGGTTLVSADAAAHLEGPGYRLESLGPQRLKNVSRPVVSFRLREAPVGACGSE